MSEDQKVWKPHKVQEEFIRLPFTIFEALYGGAAGGGKAFSLDTELLTTHGIKTFNTIEVGDQVYSPDGSITTVIAVTDVMTDRDCYQITFDDNSTFVCDGNHEWVTLTHLDRERNKKRTAKFREARKATREWKGWGDRLDLSKLNSAKVHNYLEPVLPSTKTTAEIASTLYHNKRVNHSVELASPIVGNSPHYRLDPYTLGAWLGDGSSSQATITVHPNDADIIDRIRLSHPVVDYGYNYSWGMHGVAYFLSIMRLVNNKHIPTAYLTADYHSRLELLKGLMDTDGTCARDGQCEISLSDSKLAHDVLVLISSLGIRSNITRNKSTLNGVQYKDRYRIKFISSIPVFHLERKLLRQNLVPRITKRFITSVTKIDSAPVRCIQVNHPSKQYLVGRTLIPTHNSEVLLALPILYRFHENPRFHGIIFRKSFPELKESLIPRSHPFYAPFGGKYNAADHVWNFPSGAQIRLSHLQDEKAARSHDTAEFNYIAFDELTAFERLYYVLLLARARSSSPDLPTIVRSATNPGNIGHSWVKSRFVEPCVEGRKIIYDSITKQKRIFIPAKLFDNPTLLANDPTYGDRLKLLPDMERRSKLDGDWDIFAGQAFQEFREVQFPGEPGHALHVIPHGDINIPTWYPRVLAIDWGRAAMTAAYWAAITPDNRCIIYREYAEKFKETATWSTEVGNLSLGDNLVHVALDPSAWQDRGDPETIAKRFQQFSKLTPYPASNDRVSGKLLVHEFLRWTPKPAKIIPKEGYRNDLAQRILATAGLKSFDDYRSLFTPEPPETNLPKLIISDTCTTLIKVLKNCIVDEKKPNDVAEFDGDDAYDCLRYLLKTVELYTTGVLEESKLRQKQSKIMEKYAETKDYLSFHHQMDKFEAASKQVPLRSGHHPQSKLKPATGFRPSTGFSGLSKRRTKT